MPWGGPSVLSLSAAAIYVVVAMACLIAAGTAKRSGQPARHWRTWAAIALVFAALAASRILAIEEHLRELLRAALRADAIYAERRAIQRPLAAVALVAVALVAGYMFWRESRRAKGRRNLAMLLAVGSGMVMALLIMLRIISLHQVDGLLYGPLKLNWVIDLGASLLVLSSAGLYVRLVRQSRRS